MMEGIAFYVPHKSRVLIIPCKADDFCLFIELPDKIYKKASGFVIQNLKLIFSLWSNLKETLHYYSYSVSNIKIIAFSVRIVLKIFYFWL